MMVGVLEEAVDWILAQEHDWCTRRNIATPTSARRYFIAACIARLGWNHIRSAHRPMAALVWAGVAETLGPTRTMRMLDGLKIFVGVNRLAQLAPMIAERWCELDPNRASLRWRAEERAERLRSRSPAAVAPVPPVILVDAEEPNFLQI